MRGGAPVSVAMVDLDGFQAANDQRGHAAGDELLRTAARCLASGVRTYDNVSRIGPDEFGLVLPGMEPAVGPRRCSSGWPRRSPGRRREPPSRPAWPGSRPTATPRPSSCAWPPGRSTGPAAAAAAAPSPTTPRSSRRSRPRSAPSQLERDTYERTMRALEAARGQSASSRAVSDYAGHIAAEVGLSPDRTDRRAAGGLPVRLDHAGRRSRRARAAGGEGGRKRARRRGGRVAAGRPRRGSDRADRVARDRGRLGVRRGAAGTPSSAGAGRALADLWQRRGEFDPACVRALETLLANQTAEV